MSARNAELLTAGVIFVLLLIAPPLLEALGLGYMTGLLMKAMLLAIAALSLDLIVGQGGMISLGHSAFVGLGAYSLAIGLESGIDNILALMVIALVVSGLFALVTGALALRTSGIYFLMITLAFGQMAYFTLTSLAGYGGDDGLTLWSLATLFGSKVVQNSGQLYFVILGVLLATWWLLHRITHARFGRVLRGARDNAERAEVMGFSVFRYRLTAYVISGAMCGYAGALMGNFSSFISPAMMEWGRSGELMFMVILGGAATTLGPVLGSAAFILLEEIFSSVTIYWHLPFGLLLIGVVLFARGGLTGMFRGRGN